MPSRRLTKSMAGIFQTFANFPNGAGYFQMAQIVFQMAQILRHLRPYGRLWCYYDGYFHFMRAVNQRWGFKNTQKRLSP